MQKINLVIPDNMDYRTSEAYRTLRTNVLFCGEEINAIAVTSCTPGEGKSEVSFRLAESLAETDRKILYIDADLRRSVFSKAISGSTQEVKGLSHYLSGQEELVQSLCATKYFQSACHPSGAGTAKSIRITRERTFQTANGKDTCTL